MPFQKNIDVVEGLMITPYIVKLVEPTFDTNAIRPAVATVGLGSVSVWLAVVWFTSNVVATSTVVAAVPIAPPVGLSVIAMAVNKVLLALVNVLPVTTVNAPVSVVVIPDRPKAMALALVAPSVMLPVVPEPTLIPLSIVMLPELPLLPLVASPDLIVTEPEALLLPVEALPLRKITAGLSPLPCESIVVNNGDWKLVLARPTPLIRKLAVWSELLWF